MSRASVGAVVLSVLCAAACSSSPGSDAPSPPVPVAWARGAAEASNGAAPEVDVLDACGSRTATYLTELVDTSPVAAKVMREWGDCVEGGKQVMVSGKVATTHLGPTDLPMSHVYGDDLSMNIDLDAPFLPFAKHLGSEKGETADTQIHVEISAGFIPHVPRAASPQAGQSYRASADFNLDRAGFQPGFDEPKLGDPILIMGRWIVDCGHADFTTELHAMSFLAWAHTEGARTTTRFYYNPYRDTELYSTNGDVLGLVDDQPRLGLARPFPRYLVSQVLGLDDGSVDRLRSLELIDATHASPADFWTCAPGPKGKTLTFHHDIVARPGTTVTITPDPASGCVRVHAVLGAYKPMTAAVRRCVLPWTYLDDIVQGSVSKPIDLRALISDNVSSPEGKARVALDPEAACADALAGPPVTATPQGESLRVEDTQPFPFYGVITAEWASP